MIVYTYSETVSPTVRPRRQQNKPSMSKEEQNSITRQTAIE